MTITHHLSDELLMAYSAGTLPEAFDLVIAAHVSMCDECRARLASFDAIGGTILDECQAPQMAEVSFEETLARITGAEVEPEERPIRIPGDVLPGPVQDYVGGGLDSVRWRSAGAGVRQAILKTEKSATVRLLYIPGGAAMPDHGHNGTEMTLVLKGAFKDEFDRFGRGDIEIANEDLHHTPVAEEGEACICLAASDAPLKFSGILPRLAQRFLRI